MMDVQIADLICSVKRGQVTQDEVLVSADVPNDVGLDSLEIIELLLKLEQEFNVRVLFESFSLDYLSTVGTIASYVLERQASVADK